MVQPQSSPHIQPENSVTHLMLAVLYALIPGILVYVYFFGVSVLTNLLLAIFTAVILEAIILKMRHKPVLPFLLDGSAVVTAVLLALSLPSLSPWWLTVSGVSFAIIIAKHLYGGLGYNPFNPAMVGYATLLIAFPREMTAWLPVETYNFSFIDSIRFTFLGHLPVGETYDSVTMATPLDTVKTQLGLNFTLNEIHSSNDSLFGGIAGRGWEWVNLLFMFGGFTLIYMKVINWRIPVAMLGSLFLISLFFSSIDTDAYANPVFHLFSGAAMLGAFFIATDPVTASTTLKGQLIFGAGIGILTYIIRTWGGYPDGVAFAVLLMNMTVPTIDYFTRPRVFGEEHG